MRPLRLRAILLSAAVLAALAAASQLVPHRAGSSTSQQGQGQQQAATQSDRPEIEVAFVLDTTSSMSGLIEGAKAKIWSIASRIARGQPTPRLKVGLVAYRDRGDAYVTKRFDLTTDLDSIFIELRQLRAEGGGDTPEHVGRGLGEAVKLLSWDQRPTTMKMIFLVGDAPPHDDYNDGWNSREWAKAAAQKGIIVNTIRCGTDPDTEQAWREISRLADGSFSSIDQSGGVEVTATPYDAKLSELNAAIAEKTLYAGDAPARHKAAEKARAVAAMPAASAADRLSYMAVSNEGAAAPAAETGTRDLTAEPEAVAKMKDAELPEELRALPKAEQMKKATQLATERKALEAEATKLNNEREAWLSKNATGKADSFDAQVMGEVKKKAAKYGLRY